MSLPGAPDAHSAPVWPHNFWRGYSGPVWGHPPAADMVWGYGSCWKEVPGCAGTMLENICLSWSVLFGRHPVCWHCHFPLRHSFSEMSMVAGGNLTLSNVCQEGSRRRGAALMGKPIISGLLKTLIHVTPAFGCAGWRVPL